MIHNVTAGLLLSFPHLVLAPGESLVIDMQAETALLPKGWWPLVNGVENELHIGGTDVTLDTYGLVSYANAYV